jgi:hypothetical protein
MRFVEDVGGPPLHHSISFGETMHAVSCFKEAIQTTRFRQMFGGFNIAPTARARREAAESLQGIMPIDNEVWGLFLC